MHKNLLLAAVRLEFCSSSLSRAVEMKGLLIISFLMLALLYGTKAQDQCGRAETFNEQITVDVNWCSVPVTATLPGPIGYCSNARCVSSHKTYSTPEQVFTGSFYISTLLKLK